MTPIPTRPRPPAGRAKSLASLLLVGSLAAIAAGCSGDSEAAETTAAPTVPETTEAPTTTRKTTTTTDATTTTTTTTLPPTTTTEPVIPRMPLTGVPLEFGQGAPDRPALVVKLDNNPKARPQSGLNSADIVFEEIVEVGTRFAAVFHTTSANPVGPIRSGRTQDIDLLGGLQRPLFAWSGGNAIVTRAIAESDFIDTYHRAPRGTYRRQGNNGSPHNLYSDTDALWALTPPEAGRPVPLFSYLKPGVAPAGSPVSRAEIRMDSDNVVWEWSPEIQAFVRSTNGSPHNDANTNERVNATNVVILDTPYRPSYADRNSPEAVTIGGGAATVLSGGTVRTGHWLRNTRTDGIALFADDGTTIELLPGRTWVELRDPLDPAPVLG